MADAFTQVSSVSTVQTAYDRVAFFALRAMPVFAAFASVKPGNVTNPGSSVKFTFWTEMTDSTTALTETVDPDAVALADSQVEITPAEYGKAILVTIKLRSTTLLVGFDSDASQLVARNMASSIDTLARLAMDGGDNTDYITSTAATNQVAGSVLTILEMRKKHAELRGDNVIPIAGENYACEVHPDVAYDIKGATGAGSWQFPVSYVADQKIFNNEIGTIAGFRVMETSRAKLLADGGSGTVDLYTSYFHGAEALGQAVSIPPHTVLGPVTDKFNRFQPLGWYGYFGFDTIREAALRRMFSSSSIGSN